jgi:hypothetical protein
VNKITEVGNEASQSVSDLESPARRLFVKGIAGNPSMSEEPQIAGR